MNLPKISIITPSYNQGQFLRETIRSVLEQNYPSLEYMVIDGGSTDDSPQIIREYADQLAYWVSEKDSGQSEAINKGFKRATGDIIGWLNSDDILLPGALMEIGRLFQEDARVDLVNGQTVIIDEHSRIVTSHITLRQDKWYATKGIYFINQPAMFWKRSLFDEIGYLKEEYHTQMDKELLIRIFEQDCKIIKSDKMVAGFRVHSQSKSAGNSVSLKWYEKENAKLLQLYRDTYGQSPKPFYKMIYRVEKLLRGIYSKQLLFTKRWKGKHISELS